MTDQKRPLKVFLSYASQDRPLVRELSRRLVGEGWIDTWLDEKKLLPGEDWRLKIEEAVEDSDVVITCLSNNSVTKEGYVQKELRYAREMALEKPEGTIFLIPLRLDECEVPRGLRFYQWVDYFEEKKDISYRALVESLKLRHEQRLTLEEQERVRKEALQREHETAARIAQERAERASAENDELELLRRELAERRATEQALLNWVKTHDVAERDRLEKSDRGIAEKSIKYPLARLKGMQEFMQFASEPDWKPSLVDISLLKKLRIAKGKEGLVIESLRFLGVIDDAGIPTNEFDNLKRDYQATLKRLVQEKYSDLLSSIPLSKVNQIRLVSYFGTPVDTAEYQAKLFIWFCEQSGIELPKNDVENNLAPEKTVQEKTKRKTAEKPNPKAVKPKLIEEPARKKPQPEPKPSETKTVQRKPSMQIAFWGIGFIAVLVIGVLTFNYLNKPQVPAPISTNTSLPQAVIISTETKTPKPSTTPTKASTPTESFIATPILGIGSTMISEKDGMVMVYVPEGSFTMGDDNGYSHEKPAHDVFLGAFWIDRTEVTNGQYVNCVEAGVCASPVYRGFYDVFDSKYINYPIVDVTWHDADSYCEWANRRLPTEAEWEKAARGIDERTYPWGNGNLSCQLANTLECVPWSRDAFYNLAPVGSYPNGASPYGALDMIGNVWEWVEDWYDETYYAQSPEANPHGPLTGEYRLLRGGSSYDNARIVTRLWQAPDRWASFGFRCVKDVNP